MGPSLSGIPTKQKKIKVHFAFQQFTTIQAMQEKHKFRTKSGKSFISHKFIPNSKYVLSLACLSPLIFLDLNDECDVKCYNTVASYNISCRLINTKSKTLLNSHILKQKSCNIIKGSTFTNYLVIYLLTITGITINHVIYRHFKDLTLINIVINNKVEVDDDL